MHDMSVVQKNKKSKQLNLVQEMINFRKRLFYIQLKNIYKIIYFIIKYLKIIYFESNTPNYIFILYTP